MDPAFFFLVIYLVFFLVLGVIIVAARVTEARAAARAAQARAAVRATEARAAAMAAEASQPPSSNASIAEGRGPLPGDSLRRRAA